jgi:hypothetical protein
LALAEEVLSAATCRNRSITEIDAFAVPGGPGDLGRREVAEDEARYRQLLAEVESRARVGVLKLPARNGGRMPVDALLVRHVTFDTARCEMLKVWARSDTVHSSTKEGFIALCTYIPAGMSRAPRCMISVKPDAPVNLEGLGKRLEKLEHDRLEKANRGKDPREFQIVTGERLPNRPGYSNPDPWYDGRAHGYTIIDTPRCGTVLSADEIEQELLDFGKGSMSPLTESLRAR